MNKKAPILSKGIIECSVKDHSNPYLVTSVTFFEQLTVESLIHGVIYPQSKLSTLSALSIRTLAQSFIGDD